MNTYCLPRRTHGTCPSPELRNHGTTSSPIAGHLIGLVATKHVLANMGVERSKKVGVECGEGQRQGTANSSVFLELKKFLGSKDEKVLSTTVENIYLI